MFLSAGGLEKEQKERQARGKKLLTDILLLVQHTTHTSISTLILKYITVLLMQLSTDSNIKVSWERNVCLLVIGS